MGEPIKIVVTAETEQAVAALRNFLNQTNQGLKQLSIDAKTTGQGIAGMSYYFRSGIDGIRLALAGGGTRAGFYAIDEALRGVLASGMSLSKIVPVVGALTAVAAAGYAVWYQYSTGEREAAAAAKLLATELKGVDTTIDSIQKYQKAGLISKSTADELRSYLSEAATPGTGTPLYRRPGGEITKDKQTKDIGSGSQFVDAETIVPSLLSTENNTVDNQKATLLEVIKYVQDVYQVQGKSSLEQAEAIIKNRELQAQVHAESMSHIELEKEAIRKKYQAERDLLEKSAGDELNLLTPKQKSVNDAAIEQSKSNETKAIRAAEFEWVKTQLDEQSKIEKSTIERSVAENKNALDEKQEHTDDAFNHRLISAQEWASESLSIFNQQQASEKAALLVTYEYEQELREKLLKATDDPKQKSGIRTDGIAAETAYHQKLNLIEAQSADEKLNINTELENKLRLLQAEQVETAQSSAREAESVYRGIMDTLEKKGSPNIFKDLGAAQDTYLAKLRQEQTELQKILALMSEINKAEPGTFSEKQQQQIKTDIAQNGAAQIKTAQEISDAKLKIQSDELSATSSLLQSGAAAAKMFGEEGFLAWKAIATAQAVVSGALAVVNALAQVPYPANIFAAAAAAAAAAVQIAEIEAASPREHGGPVEQGMPYVVGEAGRELFIPNSSGRIINAADTARMFDRSVAGPAGPGSQAPKIMVNFYDDHSAVLKNIRNNPDYHHAIVDVAKRNSHIIAPHT